MPESETQREASNLYLLLIAIGAFIVCTYLSYEELQYMRSGQTQAARLDSMRVQTHYRRGSRWETLQVSYFINDNGKQRHELDEVDPDWFRSSAVVIPNSTPGAGSGPQIVQVQYIPGVEGRSRLVGHSYRWVIIPFVLSLGLMAYGVVTFWRGYKAYQRRLAEE
jgi:hypothetical protein